MNDIVTIYETTSTDGYTDRGDGKFYLTESEADSAGKVNNKGWSSSPKKHTALESNCGGYFLLTNPKPVYLANSPRILEREKANALNKLSDREKEILGLKN